MLITFPTLSEQMKARRNVPYKNIGFIKKSATFLKDNLRNNHAKNSHRILLLGNPREYDII